MASRRRTRVLLASLSFFCFSGFLTAYSYRNPWTRELGPAFFAAILYPFQSADHSVVGTVGQAWGSYVSLIGVERENRSLRERVVSLEGQNSELIERLHELSELRALLNVPQDPKIKGVAAQVIGYDPSNWVQAITIDQGIRSGLQTGMAVLHGAEVVGQVVSVGLQSSRVLLITDHSSGVDALIQGSRARGVLQGLGRGNCELVYVPREEEVKVGDQVISSGMDGIYPKGFLLGVVRKIEERGTGLFSSIYVQPAVDLAKLETVMVVAQQIQAPEPPAVSSPGEKKKHDSGSKK